MSNFSELQQRFNEAEAKVNELRKQLDVERNNERAEGIVAARELIKIHGLTASELGFSGKASVKRATGDRRVTVAPKYKDPASGKTWTGRGKTPGWLVAQVAAGSSKQDFLI